MPVDSLNLTNIDRHFAAFICRLAGTDDRRLWLAAALVSQAVGSGHVCLDLGSAMASEPATAEGIGGDPAAWAEKLRIWLVVGHPGDFTPLVLDRANRLYLHRYWRYEQQLAAGLLHRGAEAPAPIDEALLKDGVRRLFPPQADGGTDWQQIAALAAVSRRFAVISGGPGTGKTSTVVKVLALLIEQAAGEKCRIALAAPTGKAAARLKESIQEARSSIDCSDTVRDLIPADVSTLHRLLGFVRGSSCFRHNRENPLPFHLVVVDEASMVSLPLMAKLVDALADNARLILLGDRDQLASVEAGAVLGDISDTGAVHGFSRTFCNLAERITGDTLATESYAEEASHRLHDAVVVLRKSFRFAADSGIGALGYLVNEGNGTAAVELLRGKTFSDIVLNECPPAERLGEILAKSVCAGYGPYLKGNGAGEAHALFGRFRILCALRQGPYGTETVNRLVEATLIREGLIDPQGHRWYAGQPVMVTRNDYALQLFNGDIGIILPDPDANNELRAFFPAADGALRSLLPLRLPEHETAYAMTVHKSQGSEFARVLLLLPDRQSDVLTRELIYTAITRAKTGVDIWAPDDLLMWAIERRIERKSGLREALWE